MPKRRRSSLPLREANLPQRPPPSSMHQRSSVHSYKKVVKVVDRFVPEELYGEGFVLDSTRYDMDGFTFVPCPEYPSPVPCPECGHIKVHREQIFIAVGALCTPPGSKDPKNAIGVFFGRDSLFNVGECVEDTKTYIARTQLHACRRALQEALDLKMSAFPDLEGVVIKTDSDYIVRHMTECITKWRQNGFVNSKGTYVADADVFNQIDILTGHLNVQGVEVLFWRVGRLENAEADALAGAALGRAVQSHQQQTLVSHPVSIPKTPQAPSNYVAPRDYSAPMLPAFPPGSFSSVPAYQP